MKKCIVALAFLLAICSSNVRSQTIQVIEEYRIPIFPVSTTINGTKLCHLAFNVGLVGETFDSLKDILLPGYYDMVFEKVRIYNVDTIFQRTQLRFKEVVRKEYPVINECIYQIPCYTTYRDKTKNIVVYPMLGEYAKDTLIFSCVYECFFGKKLEYGMCYVITVEDIPNPITGERTIIFRSIQREDYIRITRK